MNPNKLRGLMAERRMTIEKMALELEINPSTLRRKLNCETGFTRDEILRLAEALEMSNEDIITIFFND